MSAQKMDQKMDLKSAIREFKTSLERDWVLRRYQQLMQGQVPMEDRIIDFAVKVKSHVVISWRLGVKRMLDMAISIVGVVFTAPLMALIAVAVKMDSKGPVFYKQTRVGRAGKFFQIYKFRTMRQDAEVASGPVWAKENDPRITRLGQFLRTTHLDELPQFFNVLRGEMSLVGPRPERPYFVDEFRKTIPNYDKRLYAKPGVTGLAQVKRRYDESLADVKKKLRYDVLYVEKMCPLMDVKLMFMTLGTMIFRTGR
jgi:exopolysaccharide biosynthesis polyprenyl glycosylphosphotransferase